ncbi:RHS repeat domain-containing protein, partial [Enterobacter hormaechei]
FTGNAQRPSPRRWSRRWDYDYRNNLVREERDDNPFSWYRWQYDSAGRLLVQDGTLPGQEQWRWDAAGNPLEGAAEKVTHNRLTQLNGIRWRYDIHGRTVEKDNGQTRWHYRYDGEHRLTEVISQPRDRNRPQTEVSFRYDPLGRRISKTRRQMLGGQPTGKPVTTRFVWEGFRLLQEVHGEVPLTYVYSDQDSYDPLARIDGVDAPEIFWFHCQPNGTPERMTDSEGQVRWEGVNSAWGKLLRESETQISGYSQNLRMQGQYLDRETGLHYNLFRYYDPDCGRFTQQDPIGLAGGINLYQYAPNALGWVDPWGLSRECSGKTKPDFYVGPSGPSSTMPSTAYRYMDSKYAPQTIENKSAPLSYFGYTKYKSANEARDAYQIFYEKGNPDSWSDARLLGEFDTLQLYKNGIPQVQVPLANGGRGPGYELFTSAYPEYGKGGALQLLPIERNYPVIFERVTIIPE